MERVIEAVYHNGVFTPLEPLDLPDRQRVILKMQVPGQPGDDPVGGWAGVYGGLTEEEITEIERIMLDRTTFMRTSSSPRPPSFTIST